MGVEGERERRRDRETETIDERQQATGKRQRHVREKLPVTEVSFLFN